jgi:predicted RecA/RadA family phage recombinase
MAESQYLNGPFTTAEYTAGGTIAAGQVVVVGDLPLIAHMPIANGAKGTLALGGGLYKVAKANNETIAGGKRLYWDDTNNRVTLTASTHKVFGYSAPNGAAETAVEIEALHMPHTDIDT